MGNLKPLSCNFLVMFIKITEEKVSFFPDAKLIWKGVCLSESSFSLNPIPSEFSIACKLCSGIGIVDFCLDCVSCEQLRRMQEMIAKMQAEMMKQGANSGVANGSSAVPSTGVSNGTSRPAMQLHQV